MKGKMQMVCEDQERSLERTGTREGQIQCPRKGILRDIWRQEIKARMMTR